MFIVYMYFIMSQQKEICVVAKTREKAEEYINKTLEGYEYNGMGVYKIEEIKLYE